MPVIDKGANILVLILLFEMMLATGLCVSLSDLVGVIRNVSLLVHAGMANSLMVPAAALLVLKSYALLVLRQVMRGNLCPCRRDLSQ